MKQSDLLNKWKQRKANTAPARIERRPEGAPAYASPGQQRLFILQQLYPGNPFYQYAHRYDLKGAVAEQLLEQSLRWLIERQELLRTTFTAVADKVALQVHPATGYTLERVCLEDLSPTEQTAGLAAAEREFYARPFDLEEDLPLRVRLCKLSDTHHVLLLSMHHIIGDRGSLILLENQWFSRYTALLDGRENEPEPPPFQYADFAYWEANRTVAPGHYDYWRKQLQGELPLAALPHDFPRPAASTFRGGIIERQLDAATSANLSTLARAHGTTANVVFLAALNAFLYRYTGQADVLIGSPVSTRDRTELEHLVGFFNETVVLRQTVDPLLGFNALIEAVKPTVETALTHKDVPFDWLVNTLQPDRSGGQNPFFQTMFVYNGPAPERPLPASLRLHDRPVDLGTAKFDLTVFASDLGAAAGYKLGFEYAADLFRAKTIERMAGHFSIFLEALVQDPDRPVGALPLLSAAEEKQLLHDWNPGFPPQADGPELLTDAFLRNARSVPANPAVTDGTTTLSYEDLHRRAATLAGQLIRSGLAPGTSVGLYAGRSPELLTGIMGILLAGGAYVPLDPEYPRERIDYILRDAGAPIIVHQAGSPPVALAGVALLPIPDRAEKDLPPLPVIDRQQNAYLIYTSGSTGRPKGIPISHDNLAWSTAARLRFFSSPPAAFLLLSSFAFDSSVAGIFWSVMTGGKLVLSARRAEQDPAALGRLIRAEGISHTLMLPSLYQLLLEFADREDIAGLRTVMVAGEASPAALVRQHFDALPATELVNEYGPTEGTVWSTAHQFHPEDAGGKVPIGRPVYGMGHYVLDAGRQPVPSGVVGELYLSGPQLTRGYHNRPDLTAQAFFPNPFSPGQRLYKTGDLVRYRHDGTIDFLGRADQQVKVRGHRIELTGISNALEGLHGIRESVVMAIRHNGELRLVAYCQTGADGEDSRPGAQLRDLLPAYMLPDQFVYLDEFPRLPNGKVDRKNLPAPDWSAGKTSTTFAPPRGEDEERMAALWATTLGLEAVGRHDNFFDVGGDSLKSIRIIAGARKLGFELAPHHLFNHPTVAELVHSLNTQPAAAEYEALVRLSEGDDLPRLFCLHSGGGHVFFYQPLARLLSTSYSVYALQPQGLSGEEEIPGSIEEMAANYLAAIRSVQPHGPYHLLGTCFSNALGIEIAHQLKAAGEPAGRLIFVDSSPFLPYRDGAKRKSRLRRVVAFALRGNYAGLGKRLWRKLRFARQRVANPLENQQERDLRFTIAGLNKIYADYEWQPIDAPIVFIRSSQFAQMPQKQFHLDTWNYLAPAGMDLRVVPGTHLGLFAAPEVEGLAATIEQCLAESSAATGH